MLNVISQFEAQLEGLKKVHTERRKSEKDLLERQAAIAEREHELRTQFEQLKRDLTVIEQERAKIREQRDALKTAAEELEGRRQTIETAESELEQRSARVDEAAKALEQSRAETAERSGKLEHRAQQLEQAEARLAAQAEKLNERIQSLERESAEAIERAEADERRADEAVKAREQAKAAVQALHAELERVQKEALGLAEGMQARDAEVAELTARAEQFASHRQELEAEIARSRQLIDKAEAERAEIEAKAAQRMQALAEKLSAIESNSGRVEAQAESQQSRIAELEQQASKLREQIDKLESARDVEAGSVQSRMAELTAEIESQHMEVAGRDQVIADLNRKLQIAAEKLKEFGELVKNQVVQEDPRAAEALTKAIALNDQLQSRSRELESRVKSLEQENRSLRDQATRDASRPARSGPPTDEAVSLRRARLSRMRVAVREQSRKVRRANALLQERFDQCEKLLSRRAELAAAHQAIQHERERAGTSKVRSSTAGAVLAFVVTTSVLLGLSWVIAGQMHPGQYAATASVQASMGERSMGAQELAEWQTYHEQLFEDPRFVETLAEAMQRRGLSTLATPGALTTYLASSLTMESPNEGKLSFELRDEGAVRTERVLDTIVVAVARAGNRTRIRRADGATTIVAEPAVAKQDALDSTRFTYAGMIFFGGFLLTSGFGVFVWRRMATAKNKFEHDQHLEALLAESRWTDPRINIDGPGENDNAEE